MARYASPFSFKRRGEQAQTLPLPLACPMCYVSSPENRDMKEQATIWHGWYQGTKAFTWQLAGLFGLFLGGLLPLRAQVLTVDPPNPGPDDEVVIVFDASQGNQALKDYRGPVYAHTGLITGTPEAPSDWRYIQGEWGRPDNHVRMRYIGGDRYQLRFRVRDFYGLPPGEDFLQMAFVFRDRSGERVARTAEETDIYYPPLRSAQTPPAPLQALDQARGLGPLQAMRWLPDSSLLLSDGRQALRLRAFAPGVLHLAYLPTGASELPPSMSVIATPTPLRPVSLSDSLIELPLGEGFRLHLSGDPIRWALYQGDSLLLDDAQGFQYDSVSRSCGMRLHLQPQERLYGLGSRALPLDRRGYRLDIYHRPNYGYQSGTEDLYLSLPYVQSSRGYSLLIDSHRRGYFDLGKSDPDRLEIGMTDTLLSCYLFTGDPPALVEGLTRLTGRQPMPPRWALGYLQSRYGYQSQRQAEEIALLTREAGFPLDGIMLDLYWFGGTQQMGTLRWAEGQWPNPARMIQTFEALGVHVVPIIEPFVMAGLPEFDSLGAAGLLGRKADGEPYVIDDFWAGPAGLLDIYQPRAVEWLWRRVLPVLDLGAAGLWSDLVEPEKHPDDLRHAVGWAPDWHNAYPLRWMAELARQHRTYFPQRRWFHLIRSGYTGMQRYGAFPWTGDVSRSWGGLQAQPGAMLGAGLCGLGYLHSDLGGYAGEERDEERYQRWLQMGVFSPVMRLHGSVSDSLEPEPIFHSPSSQARVREAIRLRYRLMPYLYTLAWDNHRLGWPLARPMLFHYPNDPNVARLTEQYLWGRDLLVAPVMAPGQEQLDVYLPPGSWIDFYTGQRVAGRQWRQVALSADHIPTLVRAGSILPLAEPAASLAAQRLDTLTLRWYLTQRESQYQSQLYWDDGETPQAYERGAYVRWGMQAEEARNRATLTFQRVGSGELVADGPTRATLQVYGVPEPPRRIKVGRNRLTDDDWQWDARQQRLSLPVPALTEALEVKIRW